TPPLSANADAFEAEFASLAQDERLQAEQVQALARDLASVTRELETLAASGEVVTQVEVGAARAARDQLWDEVAIELAAPRVAPDGLAVAFETTLREADRRADLLRADTARATRVADARQRIAALEAARTETARRAATLATQRAELETRWRTLVAPLGRAELNPAGLRDWLARRERVAARQAEVTRLRAQQDEDEAEWRQVSAALADLLALCGQPGEARATEGLAQARAAVGAARRTASEREALTRQRAAGEADLARLAAEQALCAAERADWRARWAEAMRVLRLREEAEAAEAQVRLDQFATLADLLAQRARLAEEAATHADTLAGFAAQVATLREALAAAPAGEPARVAEQLYAALGAARTSEARRAELLATLESERARLLEAAREAETARARLAALCREAGVDSVAELAATEASAARKRAAGLRLTDLERDLVSRNGRSLQAVVDEAEGERPEALDARLAELAAAQDGLEAAVVVAQERAFEARRALDAIDGGAVAAEAQQALGALAARIAGEARGYARLRLAHALLERVIKRYRERHQGPLLARAAALFSRITVGSFAGLVVDWDDDGQRLMGERPGGERVPVSGLSHGTRDQLYLALRIAAVEQHLASRGPLPVIVDDLLAQFDDDRALATLEVLAELATRTQVLCFSHHRHLLTLVEGSPLAARVGVQTL
ncbi:MAG: ATP-binding protein, partial [Gammaproteobacteria bacterium]